MWEHVPDYFAHLLATGCSPRTVHQYRHKLANLHRFHGDRKPTEETLNQFALARKQAGIKPRTLRVDFSAAYGFFDFLRAKKLAKGLPKRGIVKLPTPDKSQRVEAQDGDLNALLAAALAMPEYTLRQRYLRGRAVCCVAVLAGSGLRREEFLDLDLEDIQREWSPWRINVRCGKGAQPGVCPFLEYYQPYVLLWLQVRREWAAQHGYTGSALIPVDQSRRLQTRGLSAIWRDLISRAQAADQRVRPHGLRHWYISSMEEAEGLAAASSAARHKRIETTFDYLHTNQGALDRGARAIRPDRNTEPPIRTPQPEPPPTPVPPPIPEAVRGRRRLPPGKRMRLRG